MEARWIFEQAYPIFVMQDYLWHYKLLDVYELDLRWQKAIEEYELFYNSQFNELEKSEMECIINYVKNKYEKVSKVHES